MKARLRDEKERREDTMHSAADNYTERKSSGKGRGASADKLIIIIFSMRVVITIIFNTINITVTRGQ